MTTVRQNATAAESGHLTCKATWTLWSRGVLHTLHTARYISIHTHTHTHTHKTARYISIHTHTHTHTHTHSKGRMFCYNPVIRLQLPRERNRTLLLSAVLFSLVPIPCRHS